MANQEPDREVNSESTRDQLISRILRATNTPDLLVVLAEQLTPTDLQSLLLEVYRLRTARIAPAALLTQHEQNRFVRPAAVDPQVLLEFDRLAFAAANPPFTLIELAPVAPLGTNSVVGLVDQNKAVATSRNTEVVSDSTNVLALECAVRRRVHLRKSGSQNELVRLCASHRLLRAQSYGDPLALAHLRLFALCTAYYTGACFHLFASDAGGQEYQVGDGGFTTWTQRLLSNAKERLLISACRWLSTRTLNPAATS